MIKTKLALFEPNSHTPSLGRAAPRRDLRAVVHPDGVHAPACNRR